MAPEEFKRKLTAILSADVEGYSRLMGEDEDATIRTLTTYRELMSQLIRKHRGRVVDSPGDNLLAEFGSVVDGVRCAVEIQEELRVRNAELPENRQMAFRIGINLGDVVEEGDRIYGDGINIAARVEGLAQGGGICISGTVYDSIKSKLSLSYESMGEHTVKNITEPVRVYRMRVGPEAAALKEAGPKRWRWAALAGVVVLVLVVIASLLWNYYFRLPSIEPASLDQMAFPLPDKPSIAVLPFTNMSGDPNQEYFSDGITESIITALSYVRNMFVISRSSTFTYKSRAVKTQQVAEELGVQYVLEGSVQKSEDRVRITAQLIDALNGKHLWAERYDRELKDIFAMQDEITLKIIGALQAKLTEGERARIMTERGTKNLEAYLKFLQAAKHMQDFNKEEIALARKFIEEALSIDSRYAMAYSILSAVNVMEVYLGASRSPRESLNRAEELAKKALSLDDGLAYTQGILSLIYVFKRQFDKAVPEAEKAVNLSPNSDFAQFMLGTALMHSERFEEAIPYFKKSLRLRPYTFSQCLNNLASTYRFLGRYDEAIATYKKMLRLYPDHLPGHANLAATYVLAGRQKEAEAEAAEVMRIDPKFFLKRYAKTFPFRKALVDELVDAWRKAGLPETPPLPLPDKPSIAVLPFTNLSDDPKQEYFSDGITDNIITALSKVPKLFVIARNSTFTYKGKPVKVQQVGRELGVRYVLEGSIQKAKDRVRITAQLIDATTGHHLWSERYDRELKDIFALQDEITIKIITAMQVKLTEVVNARMLAKGTDNLDAYLKFLQGFKHFNRFNPDDHVLALRYFKEAIALDPEFANPYAFMGFIHMIEVSRGQSKSPQKSIELAFKLAQKVLALDESHPLGHALLGQIHLAKRQHEKAIAAFERAVALAPNSLGSLYMLGNALTTVGRHQEAIPHFKRAIRVNPLTPSMHLNGLGRAYIPMERYEEAITVLKKALHYQPDYLFAHQNLAVCYAALGREEEAHAEAAEVLRLNPKFSVKKWAKRSPIRDKAVKERYIDALRKAGLPD